MMGTMGNKGSCLMRFQYFDTTFSIASGHLSAGSKQSANANRISELKDILNRTYPKYNKFRDHDVAMIFGDLNFRIDLEYNATIELIKNKCYKQLTQYDQLLKSREVNFDLSDIDESTLDFDPTYKYVIGSTEYDKKKKRVPSWCDRVLYKKSKIVKQLCYGRSENLYSDHRPIYSVFKVNALRVLNDKKTQVMDEIKGNMILGDEMACYDDNERDITMMNSRNKSNSQSSNNSNSNMNLMGNNSNSGNRLYVNTNTPGGNYEIKGSPSPGNQANMNMNFNNNNNINTSVQGTYVQMQEMTGKINQQNDKNNDNLLNKQISLDLANPERSTSIDRGEGDINSFFK